LSELSVNIIICIQFQQVLCVEKLVEASLYLGLMVSRSTSSCGILHGKGAGGLEEQQQEPQVSR
jgi:hypothetical protein